MSLTRRTALVSRRITPIAIALASVLAAPALGDQPRSMPLAPAQTLSAQPIEGTPTLRHAALGFRADLVDLGSITIGDEWSFPLFGDLTLRALIERVEGRDGVVTLSGDVLSDDGAGTAGHFVSSIVGDAISMAAWMNDGTVYEIRPGADGALVAMQLDSVAFPTCATGPEHAVHAHAQEPVPGVVDRGGACSDDGSVLDVLIVYTPAARNAVGSTNGIISLANSAVAAANTSYINSNVPTRLNLVHVAQVDYTEAGFSTDLSRLRSTSDGNIDEVHALRNQYSADFVAMISASNGACGIGYLMTNNSPGFQSSAFTVTRYSCAVGNLSFAHEIGHNMGCAHDRDNASGGLNPYSFGHRWISSDNNRQYRSVMSYSPGTRIPHFSNPDINYRGTPTGIAINQPNSAFNAQTIANSAPTIAAFRLSGSAPEFVTQPQPQSTEPGQTATFSAIVNGDDLTYQWLRNGGPIFDNARVSGSATGFLTITDVQVSDAGEYSLATLNGCGGVISDGALLEVAASCPADLTGNGTLDFFDISAFISAYNAGDPGADLAAPFGSLNFFDVSAYIASYNAGCP